MILALLRAAALAAAAAEPDLILRGGPVFMAPGLYAEAVAVAGNRIEAVGTSAEVSRLAGKKTRVLELAGRSVLPGFHDAHAHFFKGALFLTQVDLNGAGTIDEVKKRVSDFAAVNPEAEWIIGRGWDESVIGARPTRYDLDSVSTRPVALTDVDGHKLLLNTEALRRSRITRATPKLTKGEIVRDESGEPTGLLLEEAMVLGQRGVPSYTREQKLAALRRALKLARESGVTAVQSMPGIVDTPVAEAVELWRELYKRRETTIRLFLFGRLEDAAATAKLRKAAAADFPASRFGVQGVKGFVDGVLGSRTAALLEPYFDDSKLKGKPNYPAFRLNSLVASAHKLGLQVALHAIGDRAVRLALDACERSVSKSRSAGRVLPLFPCRVEHVEVLDPADAGRFKGVAAASMQPSHMTYDNEEQNYNPNRLGSRVRMAFPWKSLEDAGATLAFGTDWPVMPLHPRLELFAAVTRTHFNGRPAGGWVPQQKISLEQAVQHYTLDPARVVNREALLGSIKPGKLADLVVLDRDLSEVEGPDLMKVEIDYTIFDGRIVYSRGAPAR